MKIEILGDGCTKCRALKKKVEQAVAELGLEAEIHSLMEPEKFADLQAMSLPQLAIDGRLVPAGNLTSLSAVKQVLRAPSGG